ncbi:MAG: ribosomal protein L7/L12, partial [Clostridia bacterium]|nr:ribosomal protein L7/L12 [Clostridia bacterium]
AAAPAAAAAAPVEEKTEFNVVLKDIGPNKLPVIKLVKDVTNLPLTEAKALTEKGGVIKEALPKDEAEKLVAKFKEAGATAVAE